MGQEEFDKGKKSEIRKLPTSSAQSIDFVLEKSIFSNIFEKDIRRVFIYKKAERLAKGLHLIAPAFAESISLKQRLDAVAIALIDGALLAPAAARAALSRELLTLSSLLSMARTSGLLSPMNADLVIREAQFLLQEIASYEAPRLVLEESPTISSVLRQAAVRERPSAKSQNSSKGHLKDNHKTSDAVLKDRKESVLSIIKGKGGRASIKDISTLIRGVSEKTIQRELSALVSAGTLLKQGQRRWSTYQLAN